MTSEPSRPPVIACPWCPYTAEGLKPVLHHLEAAHPTRWCDLALSPPIADRARCQRGTRSGGDQDLPEQGQFLRGDMARGG